MGFSSCPVSKSVWDLVEDFWQSLCGMRGFQHVRASESLQRYRSDNDLLNSLIQEVTMAFHCATFTHQHYTTPLTAPALANFGIGDQ